MYFFGLICLILSGNAIAENAYNVKVLKMKAWGDVHITTDNNQTGGCDAQNGAHIKILPLEHVNFDLLSSMLLTAHTTGKTVNLFLTNECKYTNPTIGSIEIN